MISITILALILGVILGAMSLGSSSWEVGEERIDRLQRMRVTYDIISEDIKSIVAPNQSISSDFGKGCICPECKGSTMKAPLFIGESNRIKFVSANPGLDSSLSTSEYRVVSYYLAEESEAESKGVVMEEHKWLFSDFFRFEAICDTCSVEEEERESDTYKHTVYEDVSELTFRYYGKKRGDEEADWYETWNTLDDLCSFDPGLLQDTVPEKVEVKMMRPPIMEHQGDHEPEEVKFEVVIESVQE